MITDTPCSLYLNPSGFSVQLKWVGGYVPPTRKVSSMRERITGLTDGPEGPSRSIQESFGFPCKSSMSDDNQLSRKLPLMQSSVLRNSSAPFSSRTMPAQFQF